MPPELLRGLAAVRLTVTVYVDPADPDWPGGATALPDRADTVATVVESEVVTNLESVPYVRHVFVSRHQSKGGTP